MPIPRCIIQTHRDPAITPELRQTWIDWHPDYHYRFFNDDDCRRFFIDHMPDLLSTYDKLPLPVQKSDLFRYAVIFNNGGIYTDVDTVCQAPLHSYINMDEEQLVAGVEMTPSIYRYGMHAYVAHYSSPSQLLQWTFAASPRHPVLGKMLARIHFLASLNTREQIIAFSEAPRYTLELTGPVGFTQVIHDHIAQRQLPRVSILPQLFWGHNPWHNTDVDLLHPDIKLRHLYHGSWKPAPAGSNPTADSSTSQ